jgi:hypothetical protein
VRERRKHGTSRLGAATYGLRGHAVDNELLDAIEQARAIRADRHADILEVLVGGSSKSFAVEALLAELRDKLVELEES